MNVKEENICRLCFNVADNEFELIDEFTTKMFDILLLRVNLDISKDPIICKECMEVVKKCFNFKTACIDTEELIFSGDEDFMCRFCTSSLRENNFILLDTLVEDATIARMLQVLMPKMDMNIIKKPVVCASCTHNLECYIKFVGTCLGIEEKITKYLQNKCNFGDAKVKLGDILHILGQGNCEYIQKYEIKQEIETLEDMEEAHFKVYPGELIKAEEEVDIKDEEVNFNESPCEAPPDIAVYKYDTSMVKTEDKSTSHVLTHKDASGEVEHNGLISHKCTMCTYETKRKRDLKSHMLIHKDITEVEMYKCSVCTFQAKRKGNLRRHMLIHKDDTEVEMYKCSVCAFKTKHKGSLKGHMLMHKDITEVEMYKCSMCTYETKDKGNIKRHVLIHKDITEVEMYKCSVCSFRTKRKKGLNSHMLVHKDVTEVEMYRCSMCSHATKNKSSLKKHMLIHKGITEVEMYKCTVCTYETKHKNYLKIHIKRHKC